MHNMTCMSMNMFDFIFGWRKVSKCKKLIKSLHCRLNLLKNRRWCMARQLRNDVAQLIKLGHYQSAFNRVDQIYKEECIVAAYDILADFCKSISLHLSYIHRNRECPNAIKEAISSLIFASARCEELPELLHIRKFIRDCYGEQFEAMALELHTGNLVHSEIVEKLSFKKVPDEVKYRLVKEITKTKLQTKPFASEFTSEMHQEVVPLASEFISELHQEVVPLASELTSELHQEATVNQDVQDTGDKQMADVDFDHTATQNDRSMTDRAVAESSSEKSTTDVRPKIVYRDDIEERQSPLNCDENEKDQRVFAFKLSAIVPEVQIRKHRRFIDYEFDKSENLRSEAKGATKSRKRSVISVIECPSYYDKTPPRRKANQDNRKKSGMQTRISTPLSGHEKMVVKQIRKCGMCSTASRAFSMPIKRSTKCLDEKEMMRSKSFPVPPSSPHVHPKLPDYDEIAAKFMALKRENMQKKK